MSNLKIIVGSDEAGEEYKAAILADLQSDTRVDSAWDVSASSGLADGCAYSEVGLAAGQAISAGTADRAILICGTGIGMAISANKVPGIRATAAHDSYSAERSILSNNCQVLALGQRVIGLELARRLAREWIGYDFDVTSASAEKIAVITRFEEAELERRASN